MSSKLIKSPQEKEETLECFQDIFSSDLIFLYSDIKEKVNNLAVDLLNQEQPNHLNDFVNLIFNSVNFEIPSYDDNIEEEIIDLAI
jgi:hypothetical protein